MNLEQFEEAKTALQQEVNRQRIPVTISWAYFPTLSQEKMHRYLETAFDDVLGVIPDGSLEVAKIRIARAFLALEEYWKAYHRDTPLQELHEDRSKVAKGKREDYTKGDEDVLKNFKNQAEAFDIDPKVSLGVHMEKQMSAVLNYIQTDGESESEPIIKRVGDTLNYLELLMGLFFERELEKMPLIFESMEIITDDEVVFEVTSATPDEQSIKQTAICEKCERNFDSKNARKRECEQPQFVCPYK